MARIGVSEEQVFKTAESLLESGQKVTVATVRESIGSGSYSTISNYLAKWKEEHSDRKPVDVPAIPVSMENTLAHIWALAWKEAQVLIKTEREGLATAHQVIEAETKEMAAEITRLDMENATQAEQVKKLTVSIESEKEAHGEAKNSITELEKTIIKLEEQAKAKDEMIKSQENRSRELKEELNKVHDRLKEMTAKPKKAGG